MTGLLGIHVGGIPGADSGHGFWVVCGLLCILGLLQMVFFHLKRWM
ncbi:MAG: hypothetical protein H7A43_10020 [Verrucomicrobia bacterium]|nr:hypothetical protein [Kiritimatiellia bacterium]MCB1100738.1 hypothetical protein [Kiritimatiellia bacterium]MCP5488970.1 hypothetical protein [Verrucomicrobiota bacterium]